MPTPEFRGKDYQRWLDRLALVPRPTPDELRDAYAEWEELHGYAPNNAWHHESAAKLASRNATLRRKDPPR